MEPPVFAAWLPPEVQDAANVAERVQDLAANNPFRTGVDGAAAHGDAVMKIENDLIIGQTPELPASAADQARTIPDQAQNLDASARAAYPELYQRADALDSTSLKAALNWRGSPSSEPEGRPNPAASASRIFKAS